MKHPIGRQQLIHVPASSCADHSGRVPPGGMEPIGTVRWGARAAAMMGMPMLVWPMMVRSSPSSAAGGAIVMGCGAAAIGGTKGSAVAVGIG